RALAEILGIPRDGLAGAALAAVYEQAVSAGPPYERYLGEQDDTLDRSPTWSGELTLTRPDGTPVHVAIVSARVRSAGGELLGRVSVLRDVSREKNLQEQR